MNSRDALLNEKEALLDERIKIMEEALQEEKAKTKKAEAFAKEAIKKWKKEKDRREIVEHLLAGFQSLVHDSEAAGLIRKPEPENPCTEVAAMDKKTLRELCLERGIDTEGKGVVQLRRELQKSIDHVVQEPEHVVQEPVQEPVHVVQEPVQEPEHVVQEAVQEPVHVVQEPVQEPEHVVQEAVQEPEHVVQEAVQEPVQEMPSARKVLTVYENYLTRVAKRPAFWTIELLREHAIQLGIETTGKNTEILFADIQESINNGVALANPMYLLGHYEKRLKYGKWQRMDKPSLQEHCRYYGLDTSGKDVDELTIILLTRLA